VVEDVEAYQERVNAVYEEINELKLEWLRAELEIGLKDLREGRFTTYTVDTLDSFFDEIMSQGRAELGLDPIVQD
jgi:ribosome-associated toxin RatA of RatAB toxin-antitoxin module